MAFRTEKNGSSTDIVIDGFENGISENPYDGIADLRNVNILSTPKEASVAFSMSASNVPPTGQTGVSYTASGSTNILTVASTSSYYPGMAVQVKSTSLAVTVDSLIIAGGGGGGGPDVVGEGGGGGGAGGLVPTSTAPIVLGAYTITVGTGGLGGIVANPGANGTNSSFNGVTATGGGGGGRGTNGGGNDGLAGGSGGGGGGTNGGTPTAGGAATASQGNAGGAGNASALNGGGGGGAGAVGSAGGANAGNGGNGLASSITGVSVTYAGGGGGGRSAGSLSTGGTGGGGNGGGSSTPATAGTVNTGGGGGGGGGTGAGAVSAAGGAGVVAIRYLTGALTATGGSITTSGSFTIHTFNSTGTFTVTAINIQDEAVYYVGDITATTFKLYYDVDLLGLVDILANTTGTYDVPSLGPPVWGAATSAIGLFGDLNKYSFILDTNGRAWYINPGAVTGVGGIVPANALQFAGNVGHSASTTNLDFGLVGWKGYLLVIIGTSIDYLLITDLFDQNTAVTDNWHYAWQTTLGYTSTQHMAIPATDDAVYICNASAVASILENAGQTFDPATSATYTFNPAALSLPSYDSAQCLAQLGPALLTGGISFFIYPWDRTSTSYTYPLVCAESNIVRIVGTNASGYVFAGNRGRIYITNGANIQLYKKFPDQISGTENPYYGWSDAMYMRNQMYFSLYATTNAGVAINNFCGVWGMDLDNGALYLANELSFDNYTGTVPVLLPMTLTAPSGNAIWAAWINGSAVNGFDYGSTAPYSNYEAYIDTDIIPIGTYYESHTNIQVEYKLSKPLITGEGVQISWRGSLADSFTPIPGITAVTGQLSGASSVNFQKQQWVQFRIQLSSTVTTPSFTRLRELRLR